MRNTAVHVFFCFLLVSAIALLILHIPALAEDRPFFPNTNQNSGEQHTSFGDDASESGKEGFGRLATSSGTRPPFGRPFELEGNKLRACQAVEQALKNRSSRLVELVKRMQDRFTAIALGIEHFYTNTLVPQGITISNYQTLVNNITTQSNNLAPLVAKAQSDVAAFTCTANNPGSLMRQFRLDMQAVIKGLQSFRASVKDLLGAVRRVTPEEEGSASPTPTAMPSPTPTPTSMPTPTPTPVPTPTASPSPTP